MPRKASQNDEIRGARRREILRAAARVFADKGIREAKVGDIARAAGLSHGLIYHYFESKDAILEAILEEKLAQMQALMAESKDGGGPILDRIVRNFESWMAHVVAEPEMALVVTQTVVNRALPDRLRERLQLTVEAAFQLLVANLTEGQRRGEITKDVPADELATAVVALMRGLTLFHEVQLVSPRPVPRSDVLIRMLRPIAVPAARPQSTRRRKELRR
jgi:AcrR family transcriptional regulator